MSWVGQSVVVEERACGAFFTRETTSFGIRVCCAFRSSRSGAVESIKSRITSVSTPVIRFCYDSVPKLLKS